ncbi:hypothetical protein [Bradyrhizobium sp. SUTN9-2]|uniref:hypothetical protein n=1 Tax=Bradyrhizobium sp. SUTN9-2 TaxID=1167456 RepID=UPI0011B232DD|nr:hypothetical protein [Bradyrhizobium sp. SUTN9-2]
MQPLVSRTDLAHHNQLLLQLLIQQHQRSKRIAQIAVTSGYDLIDGQPVLISCARLVWLFESELA